MPYVQLPFYRKEVAQVHPEALAAFDERLASGDLPGALQALPAHFVDDFAGIGDATAVQRKVEEYRDAGATLPVVGQLPPHEGSQGPEALLEAAAPGV
jgi:hypothetical protein